MRRIVYIILFVLSLLPSMVQAQRSNVAVEQLQKLNRVYRHLYANYVDSVDMEKMVEAAVKGMIEELDPHSTYLDKKELKSQREAMEGEFSGIGVEYNVLNDTIVVLNTVLRGPAESVGVMPLDRIVEVDGKDVVGVERSDVPPLLRGEKGSVVNIGVVRRGVKERLHFSITRDMIPVTTVDAAYKISDDIGYIKVNRFGRTTVQEFEQAMAELGDVDALVLDLSNNGGGLLDQAVGMASCFIPQDSLVVSVEGRSIEPQYHYAESDSRFDGDIVVMINEASASGSEIVAGAVQDWDRGVLVGRESFGKGLVQHQIPLGDGTALRLTVARYHTPSGRVIQRPYEKGHKEEYFKAQAERMRSAQSDSIADNRQVFRTRLLGRAVYADGGIRPDVFVESDTTRVSDYMVRVIAQGVYNEVIVEYIEQHRDSLAQNYPTFEDFDKGFHLDDVWMTSLVDKAAAKGVEYDAAGYELSRELMRTQLSALVAQRMFSTEGYYRYINPRLNDIYKRAVLLLANKGEGVKGVLKTD